MKHLIFGIRCSVQVIYLATCSYGTCTFGIPLYLTYDSTSALPVMGLTNRTGHRSCLFLCDASYHTVSQDSSPDRFYLKTRYPTIPSLLQLPSFPFNQHKA
jgi:hypothetical protein